MQGVPNSGALYSGRHGMRNRAVEHNTAAFSEFSFAVRWRVRLGRGYTAKANCAEETVIMHVQRKLPRPSYNQDLASSNQRRSDTVMCAIH